MTLIQGEFFDGKTSARHNASIEQDHGVFTFRWAEREQRIHISNLTFSSRLSGVPRSIRTNTGEQFLTNDNDGIDEFLRHNGEELTSTLAHKLESFVPMVALSWVGIVFLCAWFYVYALPEIVEEAVAITPPEWESTFAENVLAQMESEEMFREPEWSEEEQLEATRIISLLENYSVGTNLQSVRIVESDVFGANAFALPGGHVVFTRGLIELAENDEQLLAIFLHELGHVESKHALRMAIQNSILALVIVAATGDVSSTTDLVVTIPTLMLTLSYSRDFESEADEFAIQQMKAVDLDPEHFAEALELLTTQDGGPSMISSEYLSTHPIAADRIERIRMSD